MDWNSFRKKFHSSWHKELKPFIVSENCNKIYAFLKANKDKVIVPSSMNTFRNFKDSNLDQMRCAVIFREPYNDIEPDGNPLSCFLGHTIHPMINMWHDAMEEEFYGLNLHILKDHTLDHLLEQDVFLHNADLTVFRKTPGSHRDVWKDFTTHVLKILIARKIPVMFIGQDVKDRFDVFPENYPVFCVPESLHDAKIQWRCNGEFRKMNEYIEEHTDYYDPQWVDMDVPF